MNDEQNSTPSGRRGRPGRPSRAAAEQIAARILEAALAVVVESGYDELTMDRVAARARVSKKTLYSRFDDKDHLVVSMVCHALDRHVWESGRRHGAGDVKERLLRALRALLTSTLQPEIIAIERITQIRPEIERQPSVRATRVIPVKIVMELLVEARDAGLVAFDDPIIPAFMLLDTVVLGPRTRFFKLTEQERRAAPVDAQARRIFETLWQGLAAR